MKEVVLSCAWKVRYNLDNRKEWSGWKSGGLEMLCVTRDRQLTKTARAGKRHVQLGQLLVYLASAHGSVYPLWL